MAARCSSFPRAPRPSPPTRSRPSRWPLLRCAREFDRAVLQAAPTGYSAVIRPDGVVEQLSDLGTSELLTADVPLRTGLTPYARAGDTPMVALALAIIL